MNRDCIHPPIRFNSCPDFPMVQYADDTLIVLPAYSEQLSQLKNLIDQFALAYGLKVNYQKSNLIPINVNEEDAHALSLILGCSVGTFPFTYLGVPLSTTKPRLEHFIYIVESIQKSPSVCLEYLSYDGRLLMVNVVLSSLPTFLMSCLLLYV